MQSELVPVVDLQDPDAPALIDTACRSVGFLSIVNHGVPAGVVDAMRSASEQFFGLPMEAKAALRPERPEINRGYAAKGSEGLSYSLGVDDSPPDLFEAFNIGPDVLPEGDPAYEAERHRLFAPNIWPEHPAELRPALVAYFAEMQRLTDHLVWLFALALGLDPEFFAVRSRHPVQTMRAFFHDGDYDALVECLPTCTTADNPPRYPPVLAGDHLMAKLLGPRTLQASTATSTAGDRPIN